MTTKDIFEIKSEGEFQNIALDIFSFQYENCLVYRTFCNHLDRSPLNVSCVSEIPYLPIEFFKKKKVIGPHRHYQKVFESSGTTGSVTSKHYVYDIALYQKSFLTGFRRFYCDISHYCVLALLPSYLERENSSLIFMVKELIERSEHSLSGFYLENGDLLRKNLSILEKEKTKTILIGVSYALLDLIEKAPIPLTNSIVMETGGMKGRREELVREELHDLLKAGFQQDAIHSEYGMTELLSQAYSNGKGIFKCPPWMKVSIRDTEDPLSLLGPEKNGGINVIDLANLNSCSFIATQDLGKVFSDGSFEVIGRFDHSDIRGCNLLAL